MACAFGRILAGRRAELSLKAAPTSRVRAIGGTLMRAIAPGPAFSVNHMFPSGPGVICQGARSGVRPSLYSVMSPEVVMRPMRPGLPDSVNQSAPSVPARDAGRLGVLGQPLLELPDVALGGDAADGARVAAR